jgi:hypothetical protein
MQHVKAPQDIPKEGKKLFLAGSIEMGTAKKWQDEVVQALLHTDWIILNPRRDVWDDDFTYESGHPEFEAQVTWELNGLEAADRILLFFSKETSSPISLLELGLFAKSGKLLVVCEEGFWRKGNVDIVCKRFGIETASSLEEAMLRFK